jgi:hypothetical protein
VSLSGTVERTLSPSAFVVDQDRTKRTGQEVLVLTPTLYGEVEVNTSVTVIGEVMPFDLAEIARRKTGHGLDLPPDVLAAYAGRPAVLATSVITPAIVDLARRPPPPLTAEEAAYAAVMKRVGPGFAELRQAVSASNAEAASAAAASLEQALAETETFWKTRRRPDAIKWSVDARRALDAARRAARSGRWDEVKTSVSGLGQACQECHAAYRVRLDDGTYRIKGDGK